MIQVSSTQHTPQVLSTNTQYKSVLPCTHHYSNNRFYPTTHRLQQQSVLHNSNTHTSSTSHSAVLPNTTHTHTHTHTLTHHIIQTRTQTTTRTPKQIIFPKHRYNILVFHMFYSFFLLVFLSNSWSLMVPSTTQGRLTTLHSHTGSPHDSTQPHRSPHD